MRWCHCNSSLQGLVRAWPHALASMTFPKSFWQCVHRLAEVAQGPASSARPRSRARACEVCVQNAAATVSLPSQQRAARARLASVLLFSDPAPEIESARSRTLRVGGISFGILQPPRQLTASGHRFQASLRCPSIRLLLTPSSWSLLSEVVMSLSQAFRAQSDDSSPSLGTPPDIEESAVVGILWIYVQSLVFESAMPASTSTGHFWHELYGLFEADAQLEDTAATEGGDSADFQAPDADQEEQQALRDAIDSARSESGQLPDIVGASVEVWVEHAAAMFLLDDAEEPSPDPKAATCDLEKEPSGPNVPRPWNVPMHGVPMPGRLEGQVHLCLGG
eukprot:s3194_g5.t1